MENCARIIGVLLDKYILEDRKGNIFEAGIRGNAKRKNNVLVGDGVEFENVYDRCVITKVLERKNSLIRPPVSNIDNLIIVVSIENPKPDYMLLDKEIALCFFKNITPIICVNKIDLVNKEEIEYINNAYSNLGIKVIYTSAKTNEGIEELKSCLRGKISAFSGNSGVGKSSITKQIMNLEEIIVGELGDKSKKGKHTTKHVRLYKIDEKSYILDTPGFSSYEIYDMSYKELKNYYPEFRKIKCEYDDCNHVNESESVCKIKENVKNGNIDGARYERYVYIFQRLKEMDDRKYK